MKQTSRQKKFIITFPDGTSIIPGAGNVPTSNEGVPVKNFMRELRKAAKAVTEAGIFDSDNKHDNSSPSYR